MKFGYSPEKILSKNTNLTIDLKSCADILGRNGYGKSTLINLVVGALNLLNGKSTVDPRSKIDYLTQNQLDHLNVDSTHLKKWLIAIQETDPTHILQGLGPWFFENSIKTRNHIELIYQNTP